jgi:hypothetical protein
MPPLPSHPSGRRSPSAIGSGRLRRAIAIAAAVAAVAGAAGAQKRPAAPKRPAIPVVPPESITNWLDTSVHFPLVPMPEPVRALYVNRWAALGKRMDQLLETARTTEINALVVDVKDDRGYVLYRSQVPLARAIGADTVRPMKAARLRAILDSMRAHGIYPIARIVVAKDPLLANKRLAWAIRRRNAPKKPWLDKKGQPWLDAHQPGVWQYAIDLAREAISLGFSEIQLDYVRFPDEKRLVTEAVFPLAKGRAREQVIREQLGWVREQLRPLRVTLAADVFGLTTRDTTDMGIGQHWEHFIDQVDIIQPMMYPSHYNPGSYKLRRPNFYPYTVIDSGLKEARKRSAGISGAARLRPWLQDFTLGPPRYGRKEVRAQIQAAYDNGVRGWVLWNASSRYTLSALVSRDSALRADSVARVAAATDSAAAPATKPPDR